VVPIVGLRVSSRSNSSFDDAVLEAGLVVVVVGLEAELGRGTSSSSLVLDVGVPAVWLVGLDVPVVGTDASVALGLAVTPSLVGLEVEVVLVGTSSSLSLT